MYYGKDHYATVTFDNAPDGRHVAIAWMSNWQYANQVPTMQYRSANSVPRDLDLYEYEGQTCCGVTPSPELAAARPKKAVKTLSEACEMVVTLKGGATITLSNDKGEQVVLTYDEKSRTFAIDMYVEREPFASAVGLKGERYIVVYVVDRQSYVQSLHLIVVVYDLDVTHLCFLLNRQEKVVRRFADAVDAMV